MVDRGRVLAAARRGRGGGAGEDVLEGISFPGTADLTSGWK